MNVLIIKEEKIFDNRIKDICDYYEQNYSELNENIKFYYEKKPKLKIDVIAIISNDICFIENEFKKSKIKDNMLVLTNNFEPKHVISCLILTENLFSLNKSEEYIIKQITNVYNNVKKGEKIISNV